MRENQEVHVPRAAIRARRGIQEKMKRRSSVGRSVIWAMGLVNVKGQRC